jgi:multiple sugar transport system permease protein
MNSILQPGVTINLIDSLSLAARISKWKRSEPLYFYICISPWLIGFFFLVLGPMIYSLYTAFTSWDGISSPEFIGMDNFYNLIGDDTFRTSVVNTIYYVFGSVPTSLVFALILAVLLNKKRPGTNILQAMFYFPSIVSGVAVFITWGMIFNPYAGLLNYLLSLVGIQGPEWLTDANWAMPSLILMNLTFCGGQMLIFIAGLKQIPAQLYEAANLDGAGRARIFFTITLPLLFPVFFFNLVMGLIRAFQVFAEPYIMTEGGPYQSTYVYGMYLYDSAFTYGNFGTASALAWILFVVVMIITALLFGGMRKRLNYEEG